MAIPDKYRSDHLFLLVGTNPLPNYVSTLLLARPTATIHLLHSGGSGANTLRFAKFLETALPKRVSTITVYPHEIHEASAGEIRHVTLAVLDRYHVTGQVGLNYTGGTKAMAIHTYRTLAEAGADGRIDKPVFSYLDARRMAMFIDGVPGHYPVANELKVSFSELAELHGYEVGETRISPAHEPLFTALAQVHSESTGHQQWYKWRRGSNGFVGGKLPDVTVYPQLAPVREAMDRLCNGQATPSQIAQILGFPEFASCADWFKGRWMEELALAAVKANVSDFDIHQYGAGLKPIPSGLISPRERRAFELDVVAMIGYQLFAISCIDNDKARGETKKHLFEAYTRAQQLGGEEARIALVSCVEHPMILQQEIEREWHSKGQIKVFGREHLTKLATNFHHWFKEARR